MHADISRTRILSCCQIKYPYRSQKAAKPIVSGLSSGNLSCIAPHTANNGESTERTPMEQLPYALMSQVLIVAFVLYINLIFQELLCQLITPDLFLSSSSFLILAGKQLFSGYI
jgi:hypothetical protein